MLDEIVRAVLAYEAPAATGITQVTEITSTGERSWLVLGVCYRRSCAFKRRWRVTRGRYDNGYNIQTLLKEAA